MLPGANEVQLSFFNGMSDSCVKPVFQMTYSDSVSGKEAAFDIDFKNYNRYPDDPSRERAYVVSQKFPNTDFTILPTSVKCGETVFIFAESKIPKFSVSHFLLPFSLFSGN